MFTTFEKLQELEKEGFEYAGEHGFKATPDPNNGGIHFVELVKYGEEVKLEFDVEQWNRVKKYLRIN